jgi:hypothetical protein
MTVFLQKIRSTYMNIQSLSARAYETVLINNYCVESNWLSTLFILQTLCRTSLPQMYVIPSCSGNITRTRFTKLM